MGEFKLSQVDCVFIGVRYFGGLLGQLPYISQIELSKKNGCARTTLHNALKNFSMAICMQHCIYEKRYTEIAKQLEKECTYCVSYIDIVQLAMLYAIHYAYEPHERFQIIWRNGLKEFAQDMYTKPRTKMYGIPSEASLEVIKGGNQ